MKVVLVNSPISNSSTSCEAKNEYLPPMGLGYLATKLRKIECEIVILDSVQLGLNSKQVQKRLKELKPDVIGINIFSVNIGLVKNIVESYTDKVKFILGGQCTKFVYDKIVNWNTKNELVVIIGEGDLIICDVVENKVKEEPIYELVNRQVYLVDTTSNYYPFFIDDLSLDRVFLNENKVVNYFGLREKAIITSRGCLYDCGFCGAAKSLNPNTKVRIKDKKTVIQDIKDIVENDSDSQCIRVLDDLFLKSQKSIKDAIEIFGEFNLYWRAMAHIKSFEGISDALIMQMKDSGCIELFIGIESGSSRIRKMINKLGSVKDVENTIKRLLEHGINVKGYYIYGFPTETSYEMQESYDLAKTLFNYAKNSNAKFRTSVFQFKPYHGTALFNNFVGALEDLEFQENIELSDLISRSHLNLFTKNYSNCNDELLYEFIYKTSSIGG